MENNDNNDPPPPIVADRLAIESLDDYLQRYGLPPSINDDDIDDGTNGEFNGLNRSEAQERIQAEKAYLDAVIARHRSDANAADNHYELSSPLASGFTPRDDASCDENGMITIVLANKERHAVPMKPMYQFCEMVRRMILHRSRFGVADINTDINDDCNSTDRDVDEQVQLELTLEEFDATATLEFTSALQSLYEHRLQQLEHLSTTADETTTQEQHSTKLDEDKQQSMESSCTQHILNLIKKQAISSNSIIEVLKLSHYLQCNLVLDALVSIVESNIDLENCLSICSLADALNLTSLFESSVTFVIQRLDAFQGGGEGEAEDSKVDAAAGETSTATTTESTADEDSMEELWKSLPYDLRSRVLTMRNILRSSIIGRGSKVSGIFFSSGNEFLAIFRETILVQKERLAEARERLEEVTRERKEEFDMKRQRRGRWFDSSSAAEEKYVYGGDVAYSMRQIDRQAKRLATLESFYEEQKVIFGRCGGGECKLSFDSI